MANNAVSIQDVIDFIVSPAFGADEHRRVCEVINNAAKVRRSLQAARFAKGDRVKFFDSKGCKTVVGTVTKVCRATVRVVANDTGHRWTCAPGLLTVLA